MPTRAAHQRRSITLFVLCLLQFPLGQRTAANADERGPWHALVGARPAAAAKQRKPALYLEVRASVRDKNRAPFVPDVTLHPGAQISLLARTSSAARVYMLHCDSQGFLSVFPDAGGIPFRADQWVALPAEGMPMKLGARAGTEAIYVLATRDELAQTDARLENWLTQGVGEPQPGRCGAELEARLAGIRASDSLQPTAANPPPRKLPYALRGVDVSKAEGTEARAFAEDDGVVVLRFAYVNAPR